MKRKGFKVYTIVTTLGEEIALALVVLLGLPRLGINIPWWGLVVMMTSWAVYSYITYWLCQRTLYKKKLLGPETLIGCEGKTSCPLAPEGYVRVQGELWKAVSADTYVGEGEEVIVSELNNFTLIVTPLRESSKRIKLRKKTINRGRKVV